MDNKKIIFTVEFQLASILFAKCCSQSFQSCLSTFAGQQDKRVHVFGTFVSE